MGYSVSVCTGGDNNGFCNPAFHQRSSTKFRFDHERRGSDRHLLCNRIRHDYPHRYRIFLSFYDESIQCDGLFSAISPVDRP